MGKHDSRHQQLADSARRAIAAEAAAQTGGGLRSADTTFFAQKVLDLIEEVNAKHDEISALWGNRLVPIHDLATARLRNPPLDPNVEHDLTQIVEKSEPGASQ